MLIAYFIILSRPSSQSSRLSSAGYRPISSSSAQLFSPGIEEEFLASPEESYRRPTSTNKGAMTGSESDSNQRQQSHPSRESSRTGSQLQDDSSSLSAVTAVPPIGHVSGTTAAGPGGMTHPAPWGLAPWDMGASLQPQAEPTSINKLLAATDPDDPGFVSPFRETEIAEGGSTIRRVYKTHPDEAMSLDEKLAMARSLLVPYMVPLFLVYVA